MSEENSYIGKNCSKLFKAAYENRYTWDTNFCGYKGICTWTNGDEEVQGLFSLGKDLKANVTEIENEIISKAISSQLWEVAIHRVKRSFDQVHGENTFLGGDMNELGLEVLVGGKNSGDKYRIKDNVVTMVYRHIHGNIVEIFTKETIETGSGYLSRKYTSQYYDTTTKLPKGNRSIFVDEFVPLNENGPWALSTRTIEKENPNNNNNSSIEKYCFLNLSILK
ncbi:DUF3386 domain-containing protein [Prochlorococcus marinus]|uniref:DUF3386 domain-containing protein n=1 Tax=Prochlorococcus marinus TaxID=1219 RepID=UPI0022B2AE83|nr:DUF3386 domain-containing protein [Prochlorococcus marinus]